MISDPIFDKRVQAGRFGRDAWRRNARNPSRLRLFDGQGDATHGAMPMSASCPRPIGRTIAGATGDGFQIAPS